MIETIFEAMKEAMNVLLENPILATIPVVVGLNAVFKIVSLICRGEWTIEAPTRSEQIRSEPIRADPPKVDLKKDIDRDLKKYFNYDVKR